MNQLAYFSDSIEALCHPSWRPFFQKEAEKEYFSSLLSFLKHEQEIGSVVYPPKSMIFNAFMQTPFPEVRVVILGQDPYHGCGQAHGLSFSVCQGVKPPPSLKNIFKEIMTDLHIQAPGHGCLLSWAHQGVLLLNATLTVQRGLPKSHYGQGWETFTDAVIKEVASLDHPVVFMLWGKSAQEKCLHLLNQKVLERHLVLQTTHPSPFSAYNGFLGARHFTKANEFLEKNGLNPIDWSVK